MTDFPDILSAAVSPNPGEEDEIWGEEDEIWGDDPDFNSDGADIIAADMGYLAEMGEI